MLLLSQLLEEVAHLQLNLIITVEIEAQGDVSVGGLKMQVGQEVDGSLHLGGIILTNLGAHGCLAQKSQGQKNCEGWSLRLRITEVIPKGLTGREVGGWLKRRGIPGFVPSKPCKSKTQIPGRSRALYIIHF